MSLFRGGWEIRTAPQAVEALQDFAGELSNFMKLHASLLRRQADELEQRNNDLQRDLGRLVKAIADLRSEDQERQGDELGTDDHR